MTDDVMWEGKLAQLVEVVWQMHSEYGHMMGWWRCCPTAGCCMDVCLWTLSFSRRSLSFWGALKVRVCLQQDNLFQPGRRCCPLNAWGVRGTEWARTN